MINKMISICMCGLLACSVLAGCGNSSSKDNSGGNTSSAGNTSAAEEAGGDYEYPEIEFVSADFAAEDNAISITTRFFIDELKERSGGKITVQENFGGTLAGSQALYECISTGQADFGTISPLFNPAQLPLAQISCAVPFGTTEGKVASDAMNELAAESDAFAQEAENSNLVTLYYKGTESYTLMTKDKIDSVSDLKGKKVAVGGVYYPSWFEAIGAVTTAADATSAYQNLKTNVYEAFWAFDSSYVQYSLYEVCDYVLDMSGGARCTQALVMNKDVYDSLDPQVQDLINECAQASYEKYNDWLAEQMDGWYQTMQDEGVEYVVLSDEEKAAWADSIFAQDTNSIDMWIETANAAGYDGAAIMSQYLTILQNSGTEFPYDVSAYIQ